MKRYRVVRGGLYRQPVRRLLAGRPPYHIEVNLCGVRYVYFRWSPTANVFDCIMRLDEAIARRLVPAPRAELTLAAGLGGRV